MTTDTLKAAKRLLRKEMAELLSKVPAEEIQRQTDEVTQKALKSDAYKKAKRVSIYVNTVGEIKTDDIIRHALQDQKQVFIPWFEKGKPLMQMAELKTIEEFNDLKPILWGICQFETMDDHKSYKETGPLDLVLAPGVAFTVEGNRLGHGMAFYDKFFCEHEKLFGKMPYKIALALNEQIIECVPIHESDVRLDGLFYASLANIVLD